MKRIVLLLLWVIAGASVYAQQLSNKFEDAQHGISINYPANWEPTERQGAVFVLTCPLDGPLDKFRENVKLIETKNTSNYTLHTYGDATQSQLSKLKNYQKESVSYITTTQGYELQKIIYGHSNTGSHLKIALYQLIKDGVIYDITCTSTILKFNFYSSLFDNMVKTLYLKDATGVANAKTQETTSSEQGSNAIFGQSQGNASKGWGSSSRTKTQKSAPKGWGGSGGKSQDTPASDPTPVVISPAAPIAPTKVEAPAPVTTIASAPTATAKAPQKQAAPVNNGIKPVIDIVQPKIQRGAKFLWLEKEITIKGTVKSPNGIFEVLINGIETPIEAGGSFSHILKLAYKDNQVNIKATDVYGNITEQSFVIERQVKVANVNDTLKRQAQDYALIIVTDNYDNYNHLTNPVNDGETIAKELRNNYGFKTEVVKDALRSHV